MADAGLNKTRISTIQFFGVLSLLALLITGCSGAARSSHADHRTPLPQSVIESTLSAKRAFELSENYLSYHLGYGISVRDLERGLLVSSWSREDPTERDQITLRISPNETGSIISAHIKAEGLADTGWRDLPTIGVREQAFLKDLEAYLNLQTRK